MKKHLLFILLLIPIYFISQVASTEKQIIKQIDEVDWFFDGPQKIKKVDSLIALCQQSGHKECLAIGYIKAGNIYLANGDKSKTLEYINKIDKEKLITPESDPDLIFKFKTLHSTFYNYSEEYISALKKLDEIPDEVKKNPMYAYWISSLRGNIHQRTGKYKAALKQYKEAYKQAKIYRSTLSKNDIKDEKGKRKLAATYAATPHIAGLYLDLQKTDSAKIYLTEALNDIKKTDPAIRPNIEIDVYFFAGNFYLKTKDYKKAQYYYLNCKKTIEKHTPTEANQKAIYLALVDLYRLMDEKDSIAYYSQKVVDVENNNYSDNINVRNKISNETYNNKEKLEENNKKLIYILGLSLILCCLLIYFSIFFYRKYKSKKLDQIDIPLIENPEKGSYNELFQEMINMAKQNKPEFFPLFNKLYPEFITKMKTVDNNLQGSELRFCAYLYLNFSTKDIAEYTYTSVRTVQTKKYNLRKKLNIPKDMDIYVWFNNLIK